MCRTAEKCHPLIAERLSAVVLQNGGGTRSFGSEELFQVRKRVSV